MNIEEYYFVSCNEEVNKFSELENILRETKGIEVQYSFPYLGRIAARIEDKKIVEDLLQKGYSVEQQNKLLGFDAKKP